MVMSQETCKKPPGAEALVQCLAGCRSHAGGENTLVSTFATIEQSRPHMFP